MLLTRRPAEIFAAKDESDWKDWVGFFSLTQKGFTKAGVRKMIARLHEELGVYEGNQEVHADPA